MTRPLAQLIMVSLAVVAAGCGKRDNSADTDRASEELRNARAHVSENSKDLSANQDSIESKKRDLAAEQQALADKQKLLDLQVQKLGSAQIDLAQARATYAAAVKERLAKLDAALASMGTKTDAKAKDLAVGLRARRDQLAAKLDALPAAADSTWATYTKDVDITFDAIEHDLNN